MKNITHFDMRKMKTLKQRLKPDIMANIEKSKDIYPYSYKSLMNELEEKVAVTQLTLETINSLTSYSPILISKIVDIYDMFEE